MKVTLDEEKKIITIETPGKNRIEISDEVHGLKLSDRNGNMIEMNDEGITIKSSKDLVFKSNKNIRIGAGLGIDAKANTDLKLKGMNVEAKADMGIIVKGSVCAELSASGRTIVKGGVVMIN